MATKRLERTVVEGGRYRYNRWQRQHTNEQTRVRTREQAARWTLDPAAWDSETPHVRRPVRRVFFDKLGPVERWLHAQVGRPWARVKSEIFATFDSRSVPGQHIVFDHLLPRRTTRHTTQDGWSVHRRWRFWVDPEGTLRADEFAPFRRARPVAVRAAIAAWVGTRRLVERGACWYWMLPTRNPPMAWIEIPVRYRQGPALLADERQRALDLNDAERERFVMVLE